MTFYDAGAIILLRQAILCHQMCPERLAAKHKTGGQLVRCPRSSGAQGHAKADGYRQTA